MNSPEILEKIKAQNVLGSYLHDHTYKIFKIKLKDRISAGPMFFLRADRLVESSGRFMFVGRMRKGISNLYCFVDMEPTSQSRVLLKSGLLSSKKIALQIDANWTQRDQKTHANMELAARKFVEVLGGGTVETRHMVPGSSIHYAGTCRMGNDEQRSITDRNCQMHRCKGLHLIDASVFPWIPEKQLTLSIVANSWRVADLSS